MPNKIQPGVETDTKFRPDKEHDHLLFDTDDYAGEAWLCDGGTKLWVGNYYDTILVDLAAQGLRVVKIDGHA
jgi:hypothetical protein